MSEIREQGKKLLKNTVVIGVGQVSSKFLSIILLPLYTSVLQPDEYGLIDLIITYASLVQPILYFQIDQAVFRFLIEYRSDEKNKQTVVYSAINIFFRQSVLLTILCTLAILVLRIEKAWLLCIYAILSMFQTILMQISRGLGKNIIYSISSIIYSTSVFALLFYFVKFDHLSINKYFLINYIGFFLSILYLIHGSKILSSFKKEYYKSQATKKLIKYSLPLIPNALSWWVINVSDRTIIKILLGDGANGIYSIANKFPNILSSLLSIFVLSWTESAAENIQKNNKDKYFAKVLYGSYKVIMAIGLVILSLMPFIFGILVKNDSYHDAYWQIPILIMSVIFNTFVSILGSVYVALKKTKEIAKTSIYCAIINIITNLIFINMIGLTAASISTLIAFFSMTLYRLIDIKKYIAIKINLSSIFVPLLLSVLIIINYYLNSKMTIFINLIISLVFLYVILKQYLKIFFKKVFLRYIKK